MAIPRSFLATTLSAVENIPKSPTHPAPMATTKKVITNTNTGLKANSILSKQNATLTKEITSVDVQDGVYYIKHSQKLDKVKSLLGEVNGEALEGLVMVDAVQRLGIDYHFQEEIDSILKMHYRKMNNTHVHVDQSLYEVSLRFRLLRQDGYNVPADVFENFKGKNGKFEANLSQDIKGLKSLYEASQLSIEGEGILKEAENFSGHLLQELMPFLDHDQARSVKNTLGYSYQKSSSTFMAKNFIQDFKGTILGELAEMDFHIVQSVHRRELLQITRWWNELGLSQELKLARNQPIKWYIWPMAALTDLKFSEQRIELTKSISLIYIIDDIFDIYGTLDELTLFTEAVNRWDIDAIEQLPHYMKISFRALYNVTNEVAYMIYKQHGFNPLDSLQKTWANLCNAFLVEAKWIVSGHLPKSEEYLKNAIVSVGVEVVAVHMFFLLGDGQSKEKASLINDNQGITSSLAMLLRLCDDQESAQDENQDERDGSYVKCYMKEHECSMESAREHIIDMISNTWKRLNKECLSPNPFSATFTKASLNLARMIPLMHSEDDSHSLPLQDHIKSMLYDSFPS